MKEWLEDPTQGSPLDAVWSMLLPASKQPLPPDDTQYIPPPRRGAHLLLWPWSAMTGMDAEHLLEMHGVRILDRLIPRQVGDYCGVYVKTVQAGWAEYVLLEAGCPLESDLFDPNNAGRLAAAHNGVLPTRRPNRVTRPTRRGFVDRLLHFLDESQSVGRAGRDARLPRMEQRQRTPRKQPQPSQPVRSSQPSAWDRLLKSLFDI